MISKVSNIAANKPLLILKIKNLEEQDSVDKVNNLNSFVYFYCHGQSYSNVGGGLFQNPNNKKKRPTKHKNQFVNLQNPSS